MLCFVKVSQILISFPTKEWSQCVIGDIIYIISLIYESHSPFYTTNYCRANVLLQERYLVNILLQFNETIINRLIISKIICCAKMSQLISSPLSITNHDNSFVRFSYFIPRLITCATKLIIIGLIE